MTELIIIEPESGRLTSLIKRSVTRRGAHDISIRNAASSSGIRGDIVVVSAHCPEPGVAKTAQPDCGFFLLPGGFYAPDGAKCVVTYGMSPKNTLTLSSIGRRNCSLALQRELVTAFGGIIDRQEIKIDTTGQADDILAVSGALLLLGLNP